MRWLFTGKHETRAVRGGQTFDEHCPECGVRTRFREVEVVTSAGVFFVDLMSDRERSFRCDGCGELFDLAGDGAAATAPMRDGAPGPAPRDLLAELEAEQPRREVERARQAANIEDELAALKRKAGKT